MSDEVPVMATPEYVISRELYNKYQSLFRSRLINLKAEEEKAIDEEIIGLNLSSEDSYVLPKQEELTVIYDEEQLLQPRVMYMSYNDRS